MLLVKGRRKEDSVVGDGGAGVQARRGARPTVLDAAAAAVMRRRRTIIRLCRGGSGRLALIRGVLVLRRMTVVIEAGPFKASS